VGIELDGTQIVAVAAFLRVINALENIERASRCWKRVSRHRPRRDSGFSNGLRTRRPDSARAGLHPEAVAHLREAERLVAKAKASAFFKRKHTEKAILEQQKARALLVESS